MNWSSGEWEEGRDEEGVNYGGCIGQLCVGTVFVTNGWCLIRTTILNETSFISKSTHILSWMFWSLGISRTPCKNQAYQGISLFKLVPWGFDLNPEIPRFLGDPKVYVYWLVFIKVYNMYTILHILKTWWLGSDLKWVSDLDMDVKILWHWPYTLFKPWLWYIICSCVGCRSCCLVNRIFLETLQPRMHECGQMLRKGRAPHRGKRRIEEQ